MHFLRKALGNEYPQFRHIFTFEWRVCTFDVRRWCDGSTPERKIRVGS
jgi:hypothetical protein